MSQFLALSLALPAVLFAAYQAKRLLVPEWNSEWSMEWNYEKVHVHGGNNIEVAFLRTIYWLCLVLALILAIMDLVALLSQLQHFSLYLWISQTLHTFYTQPEVFMATICFLALVSFILVRRWRTALESGKTFVFFTWYTLFELPVKLLLDPAYRSLQFIASYSYVKALSYLAFYAVLYIVLGVVCSNLIWDKASHFDFKPSLGLIYLLFYLTAFMANVLGSVFNWLLLHSVGVLFTIKSDKIDLEEELPLKSVRRIYYTVYRR